jgi:hypothetical protein
MCPKTQIHWRQTGRYEIEIQKHEVEKISMEK